MSCDIIIPIWNELDFTKDCINSILLNTKYPFRIIAIDNGSEPDTKKYLDSVRSERITVIRNEENLGFVKAVNQGLCASTAPYICILNNDTVPAPGWLENMVRFAEEHPDVGLINPQCSGHGNKPIPEYASSLEVNRGRYMEMNQCQGFAMLLRKEVLDKVGYLDEAFGIGGFDDTDYSMRVHKAGYKSVAIGDAYVYHRLHASFDKAGNREEWVKRNRKIYYDKWGKHLRAGIILDLSKVRDERLLENAILLSYGLAREWTWVHIWVRTNEGKGKIAGIVENITKKNLLPPHQNIRIEVLNLPSLILSLTICGKLIERLRKRMRDKRFDAVISLNKMIPVAVSLSARYVNAASLNIDVSAVRDWEKKGKEIALYLKNRQKEYA